MDRRTYLKSSATAALAASLAGCSDEPESMTVAIDYEEVWSGAISEDSDSRSISGVGPKTFDLSDSIPDVVSVKASKQNDDSKTLTVEVKVDGEVVKSESTEASYGVARVSHP